MAPVPEGRSRFLRRLPLLIVAAVGILLWKAPFFPQERKVVLALDSRFREATALDYSVRDSDQALMAKSFVRFPEGPPGQIVSTLSLKPGRYTVAGAAQLRDGGSLPFEASADVSGDETLVLTVR